PSSTPPWAAPPGHCSIVARSSSPPTCAPSSTGRLAPDVSGRPDGWCRRRDASPSPPPTYTTTPVCCSPAAAPARPSSTCRPIRIVIDPDPPAHKPPQREAFHRIPPPLGEGRVGVDPRFRPAY